MIAIGRVGVISSRRSVPPSRSLTSTSEMPSSVISVHVTSSPGDCWLNPLAIGADSGAVVTVVVKGGASASDSPTNSAALKNAPRSASEANGRRRFAWSVAARAAVTAAATRPVAAPIDWRTAMPLASAASLSSCSPFG